MYFRLIAYAFIMTLCGSAPGATIRYDLPNLLGEHLYDGDLTLFHAVQQVDTPFGFYAVEEATLVVEGRVSKGLAHGDGITREGTSFELLPNVNIRPSFANSIELTTQPTPEIFRFETVYPNPFVPDITPLPNPDGYPPVSFLVYLSVWPSASTQYPPLINPLDDVFSSGIIVDIPITATIEQAYIILSGASIVPEPSGLILLGGFLALLLGIRYRHNGFLQSANLKK